METGPADYRCAKETVPCVQFHATSQICRLHWTHVVPVTQLICNHVMNITPTTSYLVAVQAANDTAHQPHCCLVDDATRQVCCIAAVVRM
jgi:hypothetical protein